MTSKYKRTTIAAIITVLKRHHIDTTMEKESPESAMKKRWRRGISICLVGLLRPSLIFSSLFAFTPISFQPANRASPASFKWSVGGTLLWLVFGGVFIAIIVLKFIYWPKPGEVENTIRILFSIEFINQFTAFLIAFSYFSQSRRRASALNHLSNLVFDPPQGLQRGLTKSCERTIRKLALDQVKVIIVMFVFFCVAIIAIYLSGDAEKFYPNPYLYFMDQVSSCFNIVNFMFSAFDCSLFAKIMMGMLQSVRDSAQAVFQETNKRTYSSTDHRHKGDLVVENLVDEDTMQKELSKSATVRISSRIAKIRIAYGEIIHLKTQVNDCLNPQIAIITCVTLVIVVLNSYLFFLILGTSKLNSLAILSFTKVLVTLSGQIIQTQVADDLHRMVS